MSSKILSAAVLLYIVSTSVFFFLIALTIYLVTRWFDPRLVVLHMFSCLWSSVYIWTMPMWTTTVTGRSHAKNIAPAILVSNHQSQLDILAAFLLFIPFKWVSKAEVFKLPLIGWNMYLNRYILLKRGDKSSIQQMMTDCKAALKGGNSVFIFPEGTRSPTGRLKPFKNGAFTLAHEMKRPILPIAINGTRRALPKYSLELQGKQHLRVTILPAVPYSDFADLSVEETAAMIRNLISQHVDEHMGDLKPLPKD